MRKRKVDQLTKHVTLIARGINGCLKYQRKRGTPKQRRVDALMDSIKHIIRAIERGVRI
jgi:hypothetical protein